jgi:hypothetical protein
MLTLPLIITNRTQTFTPRSWVIYLSEDASFRAAAATTAFELPKMSSDWSSSPGGSR